MSVLCAVTYLRPRHHNAPCVAPSRYIHSRFKTAILASIFFICCRWTRPSGLLPAAAVRPSVTICDLRAHCRSISIAFVWFEDRLRAFFINGAIYRRSDSNDCSALKHRRTSNCRPVSKRDAVHIKNFATDRNDGRLCPSTDVDENHLRLL